MTWPSPDCCCASSRSPSAAAPAEPAALSAPSADGPSAAPHVHPAPAVSERGNQTSDMTLRLHHLSRRCWGSTSTGESTFMWSWARLSRLRVVFLMESDDRGTCFFSCSRHCLSWARLHDISDSSGFIYSSPRSPQLWIHTRLLKLLFNMTK